MLLAVEQETFNFCYAISSWTGDVQLRLYIYQLTMRPVTSVMLSAVEHGTCYFYVTSGIEFHKFPMTFCCTWVNHAWTEKLSRHRLIHLDDWCIFFNMKTVVVHLFLIFCSIYWHVNNMHNCYAWLSSFIMIAFNHVLVMCIPQRYATEYLIYFTNITI